jgi:hypothetical protein
MFSFSGISKLFPFSNFFRYLSAGRASVPQPAVRQPTAVKVDECIQAGDVFLQTAQKLRMDHVWGSRAIIPENYDALKMTVPEVLFRGISCNRNSIHIETVIMVVVLYAQGLDIGTRCKWHKNAWADEEEEVAIPGFIFSKEIIGFIPQVNFRIQNLILNLDFTGNLDQIWPQHQREIDFYEMQLGVEKGPLAPKTTF